jgi:hypothetical protein
LSQKIHFTKINNYFKVAETIEEMSMPRKITEQDQQEELRHAFQTLIALHGSAYNSATGRVKVSDANLVRIIFPPSPEKEPEKNASLQGAIHLAGDLYRGELLEGDDLRAEFIPPGWVGYQLPMRLECSPRYKPADNLQVYKNDKEEIVVDFSLPHVPRTREQEIRRFISGRKTIPTQEIIEAVKELSHSMHWRIDAKDENAEKAAQGPASGAVLARRSDKSAFRD